MSRRLVEFLIPGDLQSPTGGYGYDRRIIEGLRQIGWRVNVRALDGSFPLPTASALEEAEAVFARVPDGGVVMVDGLALGAMPELAARHAGRVVLVALVHHPLALETGLSLQVAEQLERSEKAALRFARHVVVTSEATAVALAPYDVERSRISVIVPGTDEGPLAPGGRDGVIRLLCVATLSPRKGHDLLIEALAPLASLPWKLTCVGSLTLSPETVVAARARIQRAGLGERIALVGALTGEALEAQFQAADVFVLPTRYEGYGMVVAEALARGLPVISTRTGAIPDLVGPAAGLIVPTDDGAALHDALARVLGAPALLASLRAGARKARDTMPRWHDSCAAMARVLGVAVSRVSGFSADWLALREPADTRARDVGLTAQLSRHLRRRSPVRFVDLACGTGANLRYLGPRVGVEQQWLLVDSDASLLAKVDSAPGCRVETRQLDLVTELHAVDFAPDVIVTTSALLDLVSERWLAELVERCRAQRCAALFALSYDGRISLTPSDPDDDWIRDLVNRHQLTDKGFGPALGANAWRRACELFRDAGYDVHTAQSDWNLLPTERLLQQSLLEGWAGAAMELAPSEANRCRRWLARRLAHVTNEASHITVGHEDVIALPR